MMGLCKDCRWWDQQGDARPESPSGDDRKCLVLCVDVFHILPLAWPVQAGFDAEYIYTDPEFGCVQFAAKD